MNEKAINFLSGMLDDLKPHGRHIQCLIRRYRSTNNIAYKLIHTLSTVILVALFSCIAVNIFTGGDFIKNIGINNLQTIAPALKVIIPVVIVVWIITAYMKHGAKHIYEKEVIGGYYCSFRRKYCNISDKYYKPGRLKKMMRFLRKGSAKSLAEAAAMLKLRGDSGFIVDASTLNKYLDKAAERVNKEDERKQKAKAKKEEDGGILDGIFIIFIILWKIVEIPFKLLDSASDALFGSPEELVERTRRECQADLEQHRIKEAVKRELMNEGWRKY